MSLLTFRAKQWNCLRRTRDVARIAVVTVLLRCYYFEFVVLFTYFLKRFCVVAVFQFVLKLCKPICWNNNEADVFSVRYTHVVNLFYSDDDCSLYLSASELEDEDDEGVPDLPGRYSVIINWLYHNVQFFLWYIYFSRIKGIITFIFVQLPHQMSILQAKQHPLPVSYTHLTLPTKLEV